MTPSQVRILFVARDDNETTSIRGLLAASPAPRFLVTHAFDGLTAQRQATVDAYDAIVVDCALSEVGGASLLERMRAIGVSAPVLLLRSAGWRDDVALGGEDSLPKTEAVTGITLVRALVHLVDRHHLTDELAAVRAQARHANTALAALRHDLATPLSVIVGMIELSIQGSA